MTELTATMLAGASIALLLTSFAILITGRQRPALLFAALGFTALSFVTVWRTYLPRQMTKQVETIAERDRTIAAVEADIAEQKRRVTQSLAARERDIGQWSSSLAALSTWLKQADISLPQPPATTAGAELDQRVSTLVDLVTKATKVKPGAPLPQPVLNKLLLLLDARRLGQVARPRYSIERMPQTEFVTGRTGTYYAIKLVDPANGQVIAFSERAFDWSEANETVRAALDDIYRDVLQDLGRAVAFELFVLGHADSLPFETAWTSRPDADFQVIKRNGAGGYASLPQPYGLGLTLRNDDLPNLRARHMSSLLAAVPGNPAALILDNLPVTAVGTQYRTVEIVLFVPW